MEPSVPKFKADKPATWFQAEYNQKKYKQTYKLHWKIDKISIITYIFMCICERCVNLFDTTQECWQINKTNKKAADKSEFSCTLNGWKVLLVDILTTDLLCKMSNWRHVWKSGITLARVVVANILFWFI